MALTPAAAAAIDELRRGYPDATLSYDEDGVGGALVVMDPVSLGPPYTHEATWVGFHITHLYPQADIYPHHVRRDLARGDGQALGPGTSPSTFQGRESQQLSRKSNRRDATTDSALLKLTRVLRWLLTR
jgi:hypothetical protein